MSLPLPSTLVARTVEVRDVGDLLALLPSADLRDALTWVRRGDGLVAFGEVARIETTGADRFADADAAWAELVRGAVVRDAVELPGTGPVCFGSFAFSQHSRDGGVLVVPEVVIGRRDGVTWMTTMSTGSLPPGPALAVPERTEELRPRTTVRFRDGALDPEAWQGLSLIHI